MNRKDISQLRKIIESYFSTYRNSPLLNGINGENPNKVYMTLQNVQVDNASIRAFGNKIKRDLGDNFTVEIIRGNATLVWKRVTLASVLMRALTVAFVLCVLVYSINVGVTNMFEVKKFIFEHDMPVQHYINAIMYTLYKLLFSVK